MAENQNPSDTTSTQASPAATPGEPVVESASATSSSARNVSGSAAYVIFGAVVVALCLVATSVGGCASRLALAAGGYGDELLGGLSEGSGSYSSDGGSGSEYGSDLESSSTSTSSSDYESDAYTTDEALAADLSVYDGCVTDEVSASSYSGSQTVVSDYVKQICSIDKRYNTQLVSALRAAARDSSSADEQLATARSLCAQAKADLDAVAIPTATGSSAGDIAGYLSDAKFDTETRWDDIAAEIELVASPSTTEELCSADTAVSQDTSCGAYELTSALSESAKAK